jgi:hypothetical protein
VLGGGKFHGRRKGGAVGGHRNDCLGAPRNEIVEVGDLTSGVTIGVGDRQGLDACLLRGVERKIDFDGLKRIGEIASGIAKRERLVFLGRSEASPLPMLV